MIHISDIKKFERCEKLYWYSQKDPRPSIPFLYYNENMMELCKELLMLQDYFEGNPNDDPNLALQAMKEKNCLINARFAYGDIRIKIPIMIKEKDGWLIYFTYVSCFPKEGEAQKLADTLCVLQALGINIANVFCIHLNAEYVRKEDLDVKELLVITDSLYNHKNHANHTILELVEKKQRDVFAFPHQLQETLEKTDIHAVRSNACTRGSRCSYFDACFPKEESATSILHLVQSSKKYAFLEQGITDIKDVDVDAIEGNRHQYAQIMAAKQGSIYMDYFAVQHWVKHCIQYPISYLDFEWETYAYPPYKGMKPYDVLVFQYSLHVEKHHKAKLQHYEYIGVKDCRIEFIEKLLRDIPDKGTILVYNMEGAEKLRLKQLAQQFPQYQTQLDALCDRMVDLSLPFSTGNIYDSRMEGFYSLKKLVDVFSEYSYTDLDISYGLDAVRAWRMLDNLEDEDSEAIKKALYTYCAMDTYAEVIVFHKIIELLERGYVCAKD